MKTQTERMRRRAKLEGKVGRRPIPKGRASARAVRSILAMDSEIKAREAARQARADAKAKACLERQAARQAAREAHVVKQLGQREPISDVPIMTAGNRPADGGPKGQDRGDCWRVPIPSSRVPPFRRNASVPGVPLTPGVAQKIAGASASALRLRSTRPAVPAKRALGAAGIRALPVATTSATPVVLATREHTPQRKGDATFLSREKRKRPPP